jgi:hypothetical protein
MRVGDQPLAPVIVSLLEFIRALRLPSGLNDATTGSVTSVLVPIDSGSPTGVPLAGFQSRAEPSLASRPEPSLPG